MASKANKELEALVSAEVERQINRERAILKDTAGIALKIIAGAFALLFAIFTIFGLTTWKDIKRETADLVKTRVDELIQKSDADTSVRQALNDLVNRAIVASEFTAIKRAQVESERERRKEIELSRNDWERLRTWIKIESLSVNEFRDVLSILNAQKEDRKKSDANSLLSEMLNPPNNSPYQWIQKQPDKRAAILSSFEHLDMGASATALAVSPNFSDDMRMDAAEYVGKIRYREGFDKLINVIANSERGGGLHRRFLLTSIILRPESPLVSAEISKVISQENPRSGHLITAVRIAREMWATGQSSEDKSDRIEVVKKTLAFLLKNKVQMAITEETGPPWLRARAPELRMTIWVPTGESSATGYHWPLKDLIELEPYWLLLTEAADTNDIAKLKAQMVRSDLLSKPFEIRVAIPPNASVIVVDDSGQRKELAGTQAKEFAIAPLKRRGDDPLKLSWADSEKKIYQGTLVSFSGKGFKFSVQ